MSNLEPTVPPPEAEPTRGGRRRIRWRPILAVLVPVLVCPLSAWLWATRPFASQAEIDAAASQTEAALRDARRRDCPRPVLRGEPIEGDATELFRTLIDPDGPRAACFAVIRRLQEDVERERAGEPEPPLTAEDPPLPPETGSPFDWPRTWPLTSFHPMEPGPEELQIIEACRGVDEDVERIVSHRSVCTPRAIPDDGPVSPIWRLAGVLDALARDRMRRGETRRAFELLLDGARLGTDAGRGRPWAAPLNRGYALAFYCALSIQELIAMDLPLEPGDLDALVSQSVALAQSLPSPMRSIIDDGTFNRMSALGREGWIPPPDLADLPIDGDELELVPDPAFGPSSANAVIASYLYSDPRREALCPGEATRQGCVAAYVAEIARAEATAAADTYALGERAPWLAHDRFLAAMHAAVLPEGLSVLVPNLQSEAVVRAVAVLFAHRRMSVGGSCPDAAALQAAAAELPTMSGFGGALEVLPSARQDRPLQICAPAWLAPPGSGRVRLPLLEVYCPPLSERDIDTDADNSDGNGVTI